MVKGELDDGVNRDENSSRSDAKEEDVGCRGGHLDVQRVSHDSKV